IIEQLKVSQENAMNDVISKLEICMEKQQCSLQFTTGFLNPNPYDLTPTLVALIQSKMKANEQDDKDSNEVIENEFAFDYSKSFTHKINQRILKAYLIFYMKEYESRGENFKESIHQICYTYFGTRCNIFKTSPKKLKTKKINSHRNNKTLKKFQMRRDIIDTLDMKKLGYPVKEVKALFAWELISPEISEDEDTRSDEAIRVHGIIDNEIEKQCQLKLRKNSIVTPNKARFHQLALFIPACPTLSNFPQWAIKLFDINTILSNAIDSDSEPEFTSRDARIYRDNRNSKQSTVDGYDIDLAISASNTNFTELPENFEDDLMKSLNNIDEQYATLFSIGDNDHDKTNDDIMKLTNLTKTVKQRKLNMELLSKDKTNDVSNFTKLTEPPTKTIK
ncbi:7356_t:CDS:2, partial [Funneliformis caledonium]